MKLKAVFVTIFLLASAINAQEEWSAFKSKIENYYFFLDREDVSNFSCKISSSFYLNYITDKADSSYYYPLKFIWVDDADRYYVLQPLPEQFSDSLAKATLARIQELKNFFDGILLDWEKFVVNSPLADIPEGAVTAFVDDTVSVKFTLTEGGRDIHITETFSRGGQLARVIWDFGKQRVVNYPQYAQADGKWICTGWGSQIYEEGEITSGVAVKVEYVQIKETFRPIQLNVVAQSQESGGQQVVSSIYIKEFTINESLEVLSNDTPETPEPPAPQ